MISRSFGAEGVVFQQRAIAGGDLEASASALAIRIGPLLNGVGLNIRGVESDGKAGVAQR
jgi:hypothetical protein